jgi:hypothetical protein
MLHIQLENLSDITLFNSAGEVVIQKNDVLKESFDVSHLLPGVYIIQIKGENLTIRDKILIN